MRLPAALLAVFLATAARMAAQLQSGPMIGYTTHHEVILWVQTAHPATVQALAWVEGDRAAARLSGAVQTRAEEAFAARLHLTGLRASTRYRYEIFVDGRPVAPRYREGFRDGAEIPLAFQTMPQWRWVKDGNPHKVFDFRVAAGSCLYINEPGTDRESPGSSPYGGEYEILEVLHAQNPDLMLWLGDNTYYRENDWFSRGGMLHRNTHTRSTPHLRGLLANAVNLALWDDHDFGPNDSSGDYPLAHEAREVFQLFWPNPPGPDRARGNYAMYAWGDAVFYLLDNRTFRSARGRHTGEPEYLGRDQIDWLLNALRSTQAQSYDRGRRTAYPVNFNVIAIGGQVLPNNGSFDAWKTYAAEWDYFSSRLIEEQIDGLVFVSGDIHRSELNRQVFQARDGRAQTVVEITSSPLTSGPSTWRPTNDFMQPMVPGGQPETFTRRNGTILDFKGPLDDRRLEVRYFASDGTLLNQAPGEAPGTVAGPSVISANELRAQPR